MRFGVFNSDKLILKSSLCELCGDIENCRKIAFIGAGGKTTLMLRLASELSQQGKRVLVRTTTHIQNPFPNAGTDGTVLIRELSLPVAPGQTFTIAGTVQGTKLAPLPTDETMHLEKDFDCILIEADGAHRQPIKYPAEYEPVLDNDTDLTVSILGLDALGKSINAIAQRPQLLADFLGVDEIHQLAAQDFPKIFLSLINKQEKRTKKLIYILNKVNNNQNIRQSQTIASAWPKEIVPLMITGLSKDENIFQQIADVLAATGSVICSTELSPSCGQRSIINTFHPLAGYNFSDTALPAIIDFDQKNYYVEKLTNAPQLIIAGGGHVALAVAKIGSLIGMEITIVEPRPEFAATERFPMAKKIYCENYADGLSHDFGENSYYVIVTHGHEGDTIALEAISNKNSRYIGMIGSHRKNAVVFSQLHEKGISPELINNVHAPIGLNIGAITPEEIAVSIMAEIIQVMNTHPETKNQPNLFAVAAETDEPMVLATVIKKEGSAPRGVGSRMLIKADGSSIGTIGGGAAEYAVIRRSQALLMTGGAELFSYSLQSPEPATDKMICGGNITVLLEGILP